MTRPLRNLSAEDVARGGMSKRTLDVDIAVEPLEALPPAGCFLTAC